VIVTLETLLDAMKIEMGEMTTETNLPTLIVEEMMMPDKEVEAETEETLTEADHLKTTEIKNASMIEEETQEDMSLSIILQEEEILSHQREETSLGLMEIDLPTEMIVERAVAEKEEVTEVNSKEEITLLETRIEVAIEATLEEVTEVEIEVTSEEAIEVEIEETSEEATEVEIEVILEVALEETEEVSEEVVEASEVEVAIAMKMMMSLPKADTIKKKFNKQL